MSKSGVENMKELNGWILTDDDSSQYVKNEGNNVFSLIEMSLINPETGEYKVYYDTLDINEYWHTMRLEMEGIISGFGYTPESITKIYGDERDQIIAECIFEHYGDFQACELFTGTKEDCRNAIKQYILRN